MNNPCARVEAPLSKVVSFAQPTELAGTVENQASDLCESLRNLEKHPIKRSAFVSLWNALVELRNTCRTLDISKDDKTIIENILRQILFEAERAQKLSIAKGKLSKQDAFAFLQYISTNGRPEDQVVLDGINWPKNVTEDDVLRAKRNLQKRTLENRHMSLVAEFNRLAGSLELGELDLGSKQQMDSICDQMDLVELEIERMERVDSSSRQKAAEDVRLISERIENTVSEIKQLLVEANGKEKGQE